MAVIRPVTPGDREAYLALTKRFYETDAVLIHADDAAREASFRELMRSGDYMECFLIEEGDVPGGYALMAKTFSQEAGGRVLWLEELFILPEFRGRGLGGRLLSFLLDRYGDAFRRIRLEIEPENEGAIRLYERYGFTRFPYDQMKRDL